MHEGTLIPARHSLRTCNVRAALALIIGLMMSTDGLSADALLGRTWHAQDIGGGAVLAEQRPAVTFEARGRITGTGGCNRLTGTAKISGSSVAISDVGTTRMACAPDVMQQEQKFLEALAAARTFRIAGAQLTLHDGAGTQLVRFTVQR